MTENEGKPPHILRSEWMGVFTIVFAFGGFVYSVNYQLSRIGDELRDMNKTVTEGQVITGKLVDHMVGVDKRLDALEARRP